MTLGKKIRQLRRDQGMSQQALSDKLGVTAQAVSKWENETSYPDITTQKETGRKWSASSSTGLPKPWSVKYSPSRQKTSAAQAPGARASSISGTESLQARQPTQLLRHRNCRYRQTRCRSPAQSRPPAHSDPPRAPRVPALAARAAARESCPRAASPPRAAARHNTAWNRRAARQARAPRPA